MEKLCTIGTAVRLENNPMEYTIIGYYPQDEESKELFDYLAVNASFGFSIEPDVLMFNRDKIEEVVFEGYRDERGEEFLKKLEDVPEIMDYIRNVQTGE